MPLVVGGLNAAANGLAGQATFLGLHSALPDSTGSNQTTHARIASGWNAAASGAISIAAAKNFTGGAASGAVTHVGLWSASTGGTFLGYQALTGDQASNAAGAYTVNTLTFTGS